MPISEQAMWQAEVDTRLNRIEGAIRCLVRGDWQSADLALQGLHRETEGPAPTPAVAG